MTIQQNINIDEIAEALNDKVDRNLLNLPSSVSYVVESYHSGTSWYKVWNDGFIQQGGYYDGTVDGFAWVNYLKPYSTNPVVTITRYTTTENDDSASTDRRHVMIRGINSASFRAWGVWAGYKYIWSAQGY